MDDQMTEEAARLYAACHQLHFRTSEAEGAAGLLARNPDMTTLDALMKVWISVQARTDPDAYLRDVMEDFDRYYRPVILPLLGDQPRHVVLFVLDDYLRVFRETKVYAINRGYLEKDPKTRAYMVKHYHEGYPETHWTRVLWTIMEDLGDDAWQSVFDTFAHDGGITFEDESATTNKVQDAG